MVGKRSSEEAIANCSFTIYLLFYANLLSEKISENMLLVYWPFYSPVIYDDVIELHATIFPISFHLFQ